MPTVTSPYILQRSAIEKPSFDTNLHILFHGFPYNKPTIWDVLLRNIYVNILTVLVNGKCIEVNSFTVLTVWGV